MVHDTTARREARVLKKKARELAGESRVLEGIEGAVLLARRLLRRTGTPAKPDSIGPLHLISPFCSTGKR